ncbi:MAG: UDP-N-acetylglucosamine 1-carboxyvinyltransferase [Patescibacteria group bacterium]|jgi:UDP-N-acetylglucosamine 1-carboxyvinyltransferase
MERLVIDGGSQLRGEIDVRGAKNHALKVIAATILTSDPCRITNLPRIADIEALLTIISDMGGTTKWIDQHTIEIDNANIDTARFNSDLVRKLRASVVLLGPLLARFGEVKFPHPGGCVIGQRPIDIFIDGFRELGVEATEFEDHYHLKASKLHGATYVFPRISVTATETFMMAATLTNGTTVLKNAACEPEIEALAEYLNSVGADIKGAGTHTIVIRGVKKISGGTAEIIPDRIETGTFAILSAATGGGLTIRRCQPAHLEVPWKLLQQAGVRFEFGADWVKVLPDPKLVATNLVTHEYPGYITDLQAPYTVLMTQAEGLSLIHETIYEGRLFYTDKLNKMGAKIIMCDPHRVVVAGPAKLHGSKLESPDIRAGIALVIAALVAAGRSTIENIYQIDRGYEDIDNRLRALGAQITREEIC